MRANYGACLMSYVGNFLRVVGLNCDFGNTADFRAALFITINHCCLMAGLVSNCCERIHLNDNTTHLG